MRTSAAVPLGARLRRRNSSSRRGSAARWSAAAATSEGAACHASARRAEPVAVGAEPARQRLEEGDAGTGLQLAVTREDFARERDPGGFAAAGQQLVAKLSEAGRALLGDLARSRVRSISARPRSAIDCSISPKKEVFTGSPNPRCLEPIK